MEKVPYFLVIGEQEVKENNVMVESRDNGKIGSMEVDELILKIFKEAQ